MQKGKRVIMKKVKRVIVIVKEEAIIRFHLEKNYLLLVEFVFILQ